MVRIEEWTVRVYFYAKSAGGNARPVYMYRYGRPGSAMNSITADKLIQQIGIYNEWLGYRYKKGCRREFAKQLEQEAGKRFYGAYSNGRLQLTGRDLRIFVQAVLDHVKLTRHWKNMGAAAKARRCIVVFCSKIRAVRLLTALIIIENRLRGRNYI